MIKEDSNVLIKQPQLLGAIDKIVIKSSMAQRVSDVQILTAPVGVITGANWDKTNSKLNLKTSNIEVITEKIKTEFTHEGLTDLENIYKEDFVNILSYYLVDQLIYKLDERFLTMVKDRATKQKPIIIKKEDSLWDMGRTISIAVNKGLSDLPISDNRSSKGWAIVNSDIASLLSVNNNIESDNYDSSSSYIGNMAGVDYYIDYTHENTKENSIIFGIKGNGISKGSTIFSPYTNDWIQVVNPDDGENVYFLLNRTAMTINPLDDEYYKDGKGKSGFLGSISVDLSAKDIFKK